MSASRSFDLFLYRPSFWYCGSSDLWTPFISFGLILFLAASCWVSRIAPCQIFHVAILSWTIERRFWLMDNNYFFGIDDWKSKLGVWNYYSWFLSLIFGGRQCLALHFEGPLRSKLVRICLSCVLLCKLGWSLWFFSIQFAFGDMGLKSTSILTLISLFADVEVLKAILS